MPSKKSGIESGAEKKKVSIDKTYIDAIFAYARESHAYKPRDIAIQLTKWAKEIISGNLPDDPQLNNELAYALREAERYATPMRSSEPKILTQEESKTLEEAKAAIKDKKWNIYSTKRAIAGGTHPEIPPTNSLEELVDYLDALQNMRDVGKRYQCFIDASHLLETTEIPDSIDLKALNGLYGYFGNPATFMPLPLTPEYPEDEAYDEFIELNERVMTKLKEVKNKLYEKK